jgi:chromate transporter
MSATPESPSQPSLLDAPSTPGTVTPSVSELFKGFFKVTVTGFGGVLAWARREFVQVRHWMTADEFNDLFALCQFLPGPNIVTFAAVYGWRLHRTAGAAAALSGLLVPPMLLMIAACELYIRYGAQPVFHGGLIGLAAAAAGLLISTAVQMAEPLVRRDRLAQAAVACAVFVAVGILQWSMPLVLLVMAPISIAWSWRNTP